MQKARDPRLLIAITAAVTVAVIVVLAIVLDRSDWGVPVGIAAIVLAVIAVTGFVSWVAGDGRLPLHEHWVTPAVNSSPLSQPEQLPPTPRRLIVMTSAPVAATQVLDAVAERSGAAVSPRELGVVVVSPEGFGGHDLMDDEGHFREARNAEQETVASLRKASVKAIGHVGDHDARLALDDALALFSAQRVLVFAHPRYVSGYRRAVGRADVAVPVELIEVATNADSGRS
jgi:hypothetical protein